ncbi:MAG: acyl-CoA dehydrogenase protein [Subtercola sp.]|nr:acyl-CoA dehydrogenase protein [Subtercola sp.]
MFFELDDDQRQLKSMMRSFLQQQSPEHTLVQRAENSQSSGHDVEVFGRLCAELDLVGLTIPEDRGGSGAGFVELFVVFEELGRVLYGGPLLSTMLAAELLVTADVSSEFDESLESFLTGSSRAAVAGLDWLPATGLRASRQTDAGWIVSGESNFVFDAVDADVVVLFAETDEGLGCFLVDRPSELTRIALQQLDLTRAVGRIEFADTTVVQIGTFETARLARARLTELALLCISAEQVGAATRCLEISVEHARSRKQFGRAIGSFQAIKHRCADSAVLVDSAAAAGLHAAWVLQQPHEPSAVDADFAKSICVEASVTVAASTIQVLGGIGYTWEHPAHLFYRRAITARQSLGTTWQHRDEIASHLFEHAS